MKKKLPEAQALGAMKLIDLSAEERAAVHGGSTKAGVVALTLAAGVIFTAMEGYLWLDSWNRELGDGKRWKNILENIKAGYGDIDGKVFHGAFELGMVFSYTAAGLTASNLKE